MQPNYRRCVSCRQVAPKADLLRIVRVFPSRAVQLDGMGRSVYLCRESTCLELAQKKDRLGRSLRAVVPPEIYRGLWQHLLASDTIVESTMIEGAVVESSK